MPSIKTISLAAALSVLGSVSRVSAHGFISGIVIGGEYFPGFNPGAAPYQHPPPPVIGWPNGASDTGFVSPSAFGNGDIVCHLSSRAGEKHATVAAGSSIDLQWNQWPESHHGPVLDYMAKCDGACEEADKNALKFFKIDEAGLIDGSPAPGKWASDDLIANNNTWTVTIPASVAPGNYVLRHEIIALHSADKPDGAQAYPQCINLEVTGSGTENPAGIPATQFYTPTDPGIFLSIYYPALENYTIPGPALIGGASTGDNTPSPPSPTPVSSPSADTTVDETQPTPTIEASTSPETPTEPTITTIPVYEEPVTATDEPTTTSITTGTSITLSTTVDPSAAATDESAAECTYSEEEGAIPTPAPQTDVEPTEDGDGALPPVVNEYGSDYSPAPVESSESSPEVEFPESTPEAESPTEAVPSAVDTVAEPTASATVEDIEDALPSGMSLEEFFVWFKDFISQYFKDDGTRKHARDLPVV